MVDEDIVSEGEVRAGRRYHARAALAPVPQPNQFVMQK
jgi:hypothetical protein